MKSAMRFLLIILLVGHGVWATDETVLLAKTKFSEGAYQESRTLCESVLTARPLDSEASQCAEKATKQLQRVAKEAYTHGTVLESMNRIREAREQYSRAAQYVRKGDPFYDQVMAKLDPNRRSASVTPPPMTDPIAAETDDRASEFIVSRKRCETELHTNPSNQIAKQCLDNAKKQLNRLAREAYAQGYILEQMKRNDEAQTSYRNAGRYVSPGDPYYDRVMSKISTSQKNVSDFK